MDKSEIQKEMEYLIKSLYFGKEAKDLFELGYKDRSKEFYYEIKKISDRYKKDKTNNLFIKYLKEFINLVNDSFNNNPKECLSILSSTFLGTKDNPEIETLSSFKNYNEYSKELSEYTNKINSSTEKSINLKNDFAKFLLNYFNSSYEFTLKLSTFIIGIKRLSNGEKVDLNYYHSFTGNRKIEQFNSAFKNENSIFEGMWNKKIRNAIDHSDIYYSVKDGLFYGKNKYKENKKNKVEKFSLSAEELYAETYKHTMFFDGYVVATKLLFMRNNDSELYTKIFNYVNSNHIS